jgi:hypothetical protein
MIVGFERAERTDSLLLPTVKNSSSSLLSFFGFGISYQKRSKFSNTLETSSSIGISKETGERLSSSQEVTF